MSQQKFTSKNIYLTEDAKRLLISILKFQPIFKECVILVSTDESLLTSHGIDLRNTFLEICPNIKNLTPVAKNLLDDILKTTPCPFLEYVILVLTDESSLSASGIVLRNTFLEICPNIPKIKFVFDSRGLVQSFEVPAV